MMLRVQSLTTHLKPIAQAGLVAKGIVYSLLGALTFMAAFHINGKSANKTDKEDVFDFVYEQTGGQIILCALAVGLICYCIWRVIQAVADSDDKGRTLKGLATRARYLLSGLVYGLSAVKIVFLLTAFKSGSSGDQKQEMARELLHKPFGQFLLVLAAMLLIGIGIYQMYYGLSEKYRKHVDKIGGAKGRKLLLASGKIGYTARGIVWLLIAWLFAKAAFYERSSEAGDTSKAFGFVQHMDYGSYVLAVIAIGLMCYGIFNFIRARYESL